MTQRSCATKSARRLECRDASSDLFVQVVIITAAGDKGFFCSGADLRGGRLSPRPKPDGFAPETDMRIGCPA